MVLAIASGWMAYRLFLRRKGMLQSRA